MLCSVFVFGDEKLHTCVIKKTNLFSSSRACISEFIAKNPGYKSDDLEIKINKSSNTVDIFGDRMHEFIGNVDISLSGDELKSLSLGYANAIFSYAVASKENIIIKYMSLGYDVSYNAGYASYYMTPNIGISEYKIYIQKSGFFISMKAGVRKEIFNTKVSFFGNFQKDFIENLSLNSMSFGVSLGF